MAAILFKALVGLEAEEEEEEEEGLFKADAVNEEDHCAGFQEIGLALIHLDVGMHAGKRTCKLSSKAATADGRIPVTGLFTGTVAQSCRTSLALFVFVVEISQEICDEFQIS